MNLKFLKLIKKQTRKRCVMQKNKEYFFFFALIVETKIKLNINNVSGVEGLSKRNYDTHKSPPMYYIIYLCTSYSIVSYSKKTFSFQIFREKSMKDT